jgi:hypothetical protein
MNIQEIIFAKFSACTGIGVPVLEEMLRLKIKQELLSKFDINEFEKILTEHNMQDYTQLLYHYIIFKHIDNEGNMINEISLKGDEEIKEFDYQLMYTLDFLLKECETTSLTFQKKRNKRIIKNPYLLQTIIKSVIKTLTEEIENRGLNQQNITLDLAADAITRNVDSEWIADWKEFNGCIDSQGNLVTLDDFEENTQYYHPMINKYLNKNFLTQLMISEYSECHSLPASVDALFIKSFISNFKAPKKKRGRKDETFNVKNITYTLGNLIKLDRYLEKEDEKNIDNIPPKNPDLRFIHDVMIFFKILTTDYNRSKKTKKALEPNFRNILNRIKPNSFTYGHRRRISELKLRLAAPS